MDLMNLSLIMKDLFNIDASDMLNISKVSQPFTDAITLVIEKSHTFDFDDFPRFKIQKL